ncbi:hypothetical protein TNCV_4133061 [Trichonephila clavipes]|nr:hypothetical protein TNCV_4133061 [Trichonephila clavipes]
MAALWRATGWYKRQHLSEESPAKPFSSMRSPSSVLAPPLNRFIFTHKSLRDGLSSIEKKSGAIEERSGLLVPPPCVRHRCCVLIDCNNVLLKQGCS